MAKSLKLRISKIITTTFQSCRSKDPSILPQDPVPSFLRYSPVNPKLLAVNHFTRPHQNSPSSSINRHGSSSFASAGFGFTPSEPTATKDSNDHRTGSSSKQQFSWKKEEKWHVIAKVYDDKNQTPRKMIENSDVMLPPPSKGKRRGQKKKAPTRIRVTTDSDKSVVFTSEVGEVTILDEEEENLIETENLINSSRNLSFSTDNDPSYEFNPRSETRRKRHKRSSKKKNKEELLKRITNESPARLSAFKMLIPCSVDGKVKESFAIVKKSEDPHGDFKRSMMEMILEKQMFEERDLEQLLLCFLSLNSRHYHPLIIQVFAEIWGAMYCASDDSSFECLS